MTVLITTGGQRLTSSGPFLTNRRGQNVIAAGSTPFNAYMGGDSVSLLGEGRTISFDRLYRTQPWIAVAVNKLSRQVGRLPLKVFRMNSQGDRERVRDHRLVSVLKNPWPGAGPLHLKHAMAFGPLLNGNQLAYKERRRAGQPVSAIVPLDWRYLIPHLDETNTVVEWWETSQPGVPRNIDAKDVIHFGWREAGPFGVSPLTQLGVTIGLEDAAQRYGQSSFRNGVRPDALLIGPDGKKVNPDDREELRQQIAADHAGPDNAGRLGILTGGWTLHSFDNSTAQEAQLIEQRKLNREEVAAVYDIPPPLIGILDHATYSNVQEMHRMLYVTVLGPWLTLIQDTLAAQLIDVEPAFQDVFVEFDLGEVLKGDPKERSEAAKTFIGTGVYTINEWRRLENLPALALDVADQPLIPVNNLAPGGVTSEGQEPILVSLLNRTADRVVRRMKAGRHDVAWDRDLFVRDAVDLDLNGKSEAFVTSLADVIEAAVDQADGDAGAVEAFFQTLSS